MKRIAFYSREFRLCEWPEEPKFCECSCKDTYSDDCIYEAENNRLTSACRSKTKYRKAVTSAMENGIKFKPQEPIRNYIITNHFDGNLIFPQEGQNWPAPQEAEIKIDCKEYGLVEQFCWNTCESGKLPPCRKIAVLRSESIKNSAHSYTEGMDTESGESVEKKVEKEMEKEGYSKVKHMDYSEFSDHYKLVLLRDFVEKQFPTFVYWKEKKNWACRNLTTPKSSPSPLESQEASKLLWNEVELIINGPETKWSRIVAELQSKFILTRRTEGGLEK